MFKSSLISAKVLIVLYFICFSIIIISNIFRISFDNPETVKINSPAVIVLRQDSLAKLKNNELLDYIKVQENSNQILTQKVDSLNGRIGDFYSTIGILVTLILLFLTLNYLAAKEEIKRHFDENFEQYLSKVQIGLSVASEQNNKNRILNDLLEKNKNKTKPNIDIPLPELENNENN